MSYMIHRKRHVKDCLKISNFLPLFKSVFTPSTLNCLFPPAFFICIIYFLLFLIVIHFDILIELVAHLCKICLYIDMSIDNLRCANLLVHEV